MNGDGGKRLIESMIRLKKESAFEWIDGLTHREFFVLRSIWAHEAKWSRGMRVSELSKSQEVTMPAVSQTLNALEERGYIVRHTEKGDRRAVYIQVSDLGQVVLDKAFRDFLSLTQEVVERMGEENIDHMADLFEELIGIIAEIRRRKSGTSLG